MAAPCNGTRSGIEILRYLSSWQTTHTVGRFSACRLVPLGRRSLVCRGYVATRCRYSVYSLTTPVPRRAHGDIFQRRHLPSLARRGVIVVWRRCAGCAGCVVFRRRRRAWCSCHRRIYQQRGQWSHPRWCWNDDNVVVVVTAAAAVTTRWLQPNTSHSSLIDRWHRNHVSPALSFTPFRHTIKLFCDARFAVHHGVFAPWHNQWRNILTGVPWTNYIKGPVPHFEFTEEFIIIKVLTKITIKHKTMIKCEVKSNFIIKAKLSV